jgi:hypothetical protein
MVTVNGDIFACLDWKDPDHVPATSGLFWFDAAPPAALPGPYPDAVIDNDKTRQLMIRKPTELFVLFLIFFSLPVIIR